MALAQTLKTRYAEQKEEIEQVYRSFKGVLMKLKNMCSDDARIIREIKDMHQQLTIEYEKIDLFDVEVRKLNQSLLKTQTDCERDIQRCKKDQQAYQKKLDSRKDNMRAAERKKNELRDEQLKEEEILRQLQRKNERHDENTKNCVIVQGGLAGACAVLGALAVIFPPVGVPALFAVGGTAATGVAAGVVGIIEQAKKASEEKLNSLRENISNVSRHLDQLKKEIKNDEECVQCYRKQIDEANVKLDQANRSIIKCGDMQKNIHIWTDHLGAWIAFLIKITPEAARIQRNVKGNTSSLRRSIEEFKITFSGEINILIEACAKILAIQN